MSLEEMLCLLNNNTTKSKQRYHIWQSHETVEDISDGPDSAHRHVRSDKDSQNVDPPKDLNVMHFFLPLVRYSRQRSL